MFDFLCDLVVTATHMIVPRVFSVSIAVSGFWVLSIKKVTLLLIVNVSGR